MYFEHTADSDTASTYQVSSVQLVTDKKLEAFNKVLYSIDHDTCGKMDIAVKQ